MADYEEQFINSIKANPHQFSQRETQVAPLAHPPVHMLPSKNVTDLLSHSKETHEGEIEYRNHHLAAEHARHETQMSRAERWNAEQQARSHQNQLLYWLDRAANSRFVETVNTIGDALNPFITFPHDSYNAYQSFREGHIGRGVLSSASAALDVLAFVPVDTLVSGGAKAGAAVSKLGFFGRRAKVVVPNSSSDLLRKTVNIGEFSELAVPMNHRTVQRIAAEAGVGLDGVKIKIIRDPKLLELPFAGRATHKGVIELYPNAFSDTETLVKTLGHERTHIMQAKIYGHPDYIPNGLELLQKFEKGAYGIEDSFWKYYQMNKTGKYDYFGANNELHAMASRPR